MTALACDDLAVKITSADVPVLLLDTCAILDVVRAPVQDRLGTHDIRAILTLLSRITAAQPKVSFVMTAQVLEEFRENIDKVETETCDALEKATDTFATILKRMAELSPNDCIPGAVELLSLGFPERSRQFAEQIVQSSCVLIDDPAEVLKAFDRVRLAKPPATRAKQSIKDCLIAESYLRLSATLCVGGFRRNVVFATSNTRDYQQGHRSLHPALRRSLTRPVSHIRPIGRPRGMSWTGAEVHLQLRLPFSVRSSPLLTSHFLSERPSELSQRRLRRGHSRNSGMARSLAVPEKSTESVWKDAGA